MVRTVAGRLVRSGRVGLLPAAYNPPTVAHLALAHAAQRTFGLDQVVYVLAEAMPHKRVERPGFQERLQWLSALAKDQPRRAAAACGPGLVIEMVQAFRGEFGPACDIFVISGRDAAERYASWDYGTGMPFAEQLRHFRLVVAARDGEYRVDAGHEGRILLFRIDPRSGEASSTAVREAVRKGAGWREHVPPAIRDAVGEAYGGSMP